jgi:hypothetical protein
VLLLVPSSLEAEGLPDLPGLKPVVLGVGPLEAAFAALERIPRGGVVVLAGLAGTYAPQRFPLGAVARGSTVALEGIGRGAGPVAQPIRGLPPAPPLPLPAPVPGADGLPAAALLTVCAASGNASEAAVRCEAWPGVDLEEMEGYAVLRAAEARGASLTVLRAVSNVAGEDRARWEVPRAIEALGRALLRVAAAR